MSNFLSHTLIGFVPVGYVGNGYSLPSLHPATHGTSHLNKHHSHLHRLHLLSMYLCHLPFSSLDRALVPLLQSQHRNSDKLQSSCSRDQSTMLQSIFLYLQIKHKCGRCKPLSQLQRALIGICKATTLQADNATRRSSFGMLQGQ